jgi:16S rRNA (adenine(1408)-N(1))-methyltransferase
MEGIRGKTMFTIDRPELAALAAAHHAALIDLGTGDGRYIRHVAKERADWLAIGLDACRENLRDASRRAPANALYLIADALALPPELGGLATHVTINFPWGSLLGGLLEGDTSLLKGLRRLGCSRLDIEVRLNADALHEQGWKPAAGVDRIGRMLYCAGFDLLDERAMGPEELARLPTTWARRLAHGRDPRGVYLRWSAGRLSPTCIGASRRTAADRFERARC